MAMFVNVATELKERTENMKIILWMLLLSPTLYATTFREEKIDLGKGQALTVINLKHEFWVGKFEITMGEWLAVMGQPKPASALACVLHDKALSGDRKPMTDIGLSLAEAFCKAASEKTGRVIRLPTEKEWEFFADGTSLSDAVCSVGMGKNGLNAPADVGSKGPNRFGLYDVLGNVLEICSGDWATYKDSKGKRGSSRPTASSGSAPWTILRGGAHWFGSTEMMKVGFRDYCIGKDVIMGAGTGFRCVVDGDGK